MKQKDWRQNRKGFSSQQWDAYALIIIRLKKRDFFFLLFEPPSKNVIRRHQQGVTTLEFLPPCRRVPCYTAHFIDTLPPKRYECKYP